MKTKLSFNDAVQKLASFGIKEEQIYLIDLVPLVEMAWADGRIQKTEVDILFVYLKSHVKSINRLAGCPVLNEEIAIDFIKKLLHTRPEEELLEEIRKILFSIRIENKQDDDALENKMAILNGCLDIAASAVTKYPYGLTERFTTEEKDYYHKIQELLCGTNV